MLRFSFTCHHPLLSILAELLLCVAHDIQVADKFQDIHLATCVVNPCDITDPLTFRCHCGDTCVADYNKEPHSFLSPCSVHDETFTSSVGYLGNRVGGLLQLLR